MPSQKTLCQQCRTLVPTLEMPDHIWKMHGIADEFAQRAYVAPVEHPFDRARAAISKLTPEQQSDVLEIPAFRQRALGWPAPKIAATTVAEPDAIAEVLGAVCCGATLQIRMDGTSTLVATLESRTGARYAISIGEALGPVLVKLAHDWRHAIA